MVPRYQEKGKHMFDAEPEACCIKIVGINWMHTKRWEQEAAIALQESDVFQIRTRI